MPTTSPLLPQKSIHLLQQIVSTLLYYDITVDPIILVALGNLSYQQSKAAEKTYDATLWLLNYTDSNPEATIQYTASNMII